MISAENPSANGLRAIASVRVRFTRSCGCEGVAGEFAEAAIKINTPQIPAAITYSHFQEMPAPRSAATMAGPRIDPTPKNPSTRFMVEVCCVVEWEMSPIKARAPILKRLTPNPETISRHINTEKRSPTANDKELTP